MQTGFLSVVQAPLLTTVKFEEHDAAVQVQPVPCTSTVQFLNLI